MTDLVAIMVVEDNSTLQSLIGDTLADGGFDTAISASGDEAVALLKGNKGKYRALVTDIHLAGKMDGWEVAKQARGIDPEFPIIYMTGAAADEWASHGVPNAGALVISPRCHHAHIVAHRYQHFGLFFGQ